MNPPSKLKRPFLKSWPKVIQGGMGVNVSGWQLAKAVSKAGQLGVVSGVALDQVMTRKLQLGDSGGHIQRALSAFPHQPVVERILDKYVHKAKSKTRRFRTPPMLKLHLGQELKELLMVSNFVEVFLAREGHDKPVGINYLEKMQMATLPSLYGAMLAGVSFVLMGAGIPRDIPEVLDQFSVHQEAFLPITVENATEKYVATFDPEEHIDPETRTLPLARPYFLPIVSSHALAQTLVKKSKSPIDGLVIEGNIAGGHNAPSRGNVKDEEGHPIYGPRDTPDLERVRALNLPFYLAGGFSDASQLQAALALGAAGIQAGSIFALSQESNLDPTWKKAILRAVKENNLQVRTDGKASPTGFPFKVAQVPGSVSETGVFQERERRCDVGCLRKPYEVSPGEVAYRCPAEPIDAFVGKGGLREEALEARCLCNGLLANVGLAQSWDGKAEPSILTLGQKRLPKALFAQTEEAPRASDLVQMLLS